MDFATRWSVNGECHFQVSTKRNLATQKIRNAHDNAFCLQRDRKYQAVYPLLV